MRANHAQQQAYQQQLHQRMREVSQAFERTLTRDEISGVSAYMRDDLQRDAHDPFVQGLLASPKFYETAYKAYQYDRMQQSPPPRPAPKPAPQVSRQGVGRGAAAASGERSLQSLNGRLNQTGSICLAKRAHLPKGPASPDSASGLRVFPGTADRFGSMRRSRVQSGYSPIQLVGSVGLFGSHLIHSALVLERTVVNAPIQPEQENT